MRPATALPDAMDPTHLSRVAGRTDGRTALVTRRRFRGGLCSSMAMSTGHSSDGYAVRERRPYTTIACTPLIFTN